MAHCSSDLSPSPVAAVMHRACRIMLANGACAARAEWLERLTDPQGDRAVVRARRASVRANVRHARSQRARAFGNRLARRSTEIAVIADAYWLKRPRPSRAQCSSLLSPSPLRRSRAMELFIGARQVPRAARRAWMTGIKKGTAGVQVPVLKAFAVPNFPHLGYQQWLQHVTLQIPCPAWEQARGEKWCRAMGSGVGIALGDIFEERPAQYDSDLELFDARLEQVTRYVRENWARVNDNGDSPPEFDEEDIAPQLCEWHRLGGPSECIDSPHTQFGRE